MGSIQKHHFHQASSKDGKEEKKQKLNKVINNSFNYNKIVLNCTKNYKVVKKIELFT